MNGLNGFDSKARFTGDKSLRGGRQKGAESYISSPSLTGRIDFFGLPNIRLGVSGYLGNSQSTLYDGINRKDVSSMERADSSIVTIGLAGADIRYSNNGLNKILELIAISDQQ